MSDIEDLCLIGIPDHDSFSSKKKTEMSSKFLFIIAVVLVAFTVRVAYLEAPSFWVDEAISRYRAQITPVQMISELGFDQMPLYYLLLQVWVIFLGSSVFSLRMLSVLVGTLVIPQIYLLGKRLYSEKTGQIVACIASISPFLVFYSRMARAYPLLWFFVLLAINSYLQALRIKTWYAWLLYALAATAAAYTHFTALPILGFLGLHTLLQREERLKYQLKKWVVAHLLMLLAFAPYISRLVDMVFNSSSTVVMSRGSLSFWHLADIFVSWNLGHAFGTTKITFFLSTISFGLVVTIGIFSALVRVSGKPSLRAGILQTMQKLNLQDPEMFLLGCSFSLLLLAVVAKLLSPDRLSFSPRNFSVAALPYYILLAHGTQCLKPPFLQRAMLFGGALIMLVAIGISVDQDAGVNWRWVAQHIEDQEQPNDVVLIIPAGQYLPALETYYAGTSTLVQRSVDLVDDSNVDEWLSVVIDHRRIWLITINDVQFDPQDRIGDWLASRCRREEQKVLIPKHARMRLYVGCLEESP